MASMQPARGWPLCWAQGARAALKPARLARRLASGSGKHKRAPRWRASQHGANGSHAAARGWPQGVVPDAQPSPLGTLARARGWQARVSVSPARQAARRRQLTAAARGWSCFLLAAKARSSAHHASAEPACALQSRTASP
jgi:hypothetical protein